MEAAGLALGVFPLGLNLIKEIRKFTDAYKDQDEELASAKLQIESIQGWLQILDSQTKAMYSSSGTLARVLEDHLQNIRDQMEKLEQFTKKFRNNEESSGNWKGKAKDKFERVKYIFKQDDLKTLQVRLSQLESSLQNALSVLNIHTNHDLHEQTRRMLSRVLEQAPNPIQAAMQLASNTSALAAIADDFGIRRTDIEQVQQRILALSGSTRIASTSHSRRCRCPTRRRPGQQSSVFGPFAAISKAESDAYHRPDCRFRGEKSQEWGVGLMRNNESYLSWFVALSISFSIERRGVVRPSFGIAIRNQIDMMRSPPIRFLETVNHDWDYRHFRWEFSESFSPSITEEYEKYKTYCFRRLLHESDFSMSDVDSRTGKTILHAATETLTGVDVWHVSSTVTLSDIVRLLPDELRETEDSNGLIPWAQALVHSRQLSSALIPTDIASSMVSLDSHETIRRLHKEDVQECHVPWDIVWEYITGLYQNPGLMEDLNVESLGRRIIRHLEPGIIESLEGGPNMIWRPIYSSELWQLFPLDLAALWYPKSLPLIWDLAKSRASTYEERRIWNLTSGRVLEALLHGHGKALSSHFSQQIRSSQVANQLLSDYEESQEHVLNHGCPMHWDTLSGPFEHKYKFHDSEETMADYCQALVGHLARRRRDLANLACSKLPSEDQRTFGVVKDIPLDLNAGAVWRKLDQAVGMAYPDLNPGSGRVSVFELTADDPIRPVLIEAGFVLDQRVQYMIDFQINHPQSWESVQDGSWLENWKQPMVSWCLRSCTANYLAYTTIQAEFVTQTHILHVMAVWFAQDLRYRHRYLAPAENSWEYDLHPHLLQEVRDFCECGCSSNGCIPLTSLLCRLSTNWPLPMFHNCQPSNNPEGKITLDDEVDPDWILMIATFIDIHSECQPPDISIVKEFLRFCTFDMLECRHTCCKEAMKLYFGGPFVLNNPSSKPFTFAELEAQDHDGIREEDEEKLQLLEELMGQVMSLWHEKPRKLVDFIGECWEPLIEKALSSVGSEPTVVEVGEDTVKLETSTENVKVFPRQVLISQLEEWTEPGFFKSQAEAKMSDEEWERYQRGVLQQSKDALDELCVEITGQKDWATRSYGLGDVA